MPTHDADAPPPNGLPLLAAAAVQDDLLAAGHDLARLQRLLADASESLSGHFHAASAQLRQALHAAAVHPDVELPALHRSMEHLAGAITAMQFQDLASQLIDHAAGRLRGCADRLARDAIGDDDGPAFVDHAPRRPNPVIQDEMDAGSVELF
jgi:hypothetical protein